MSPHSDSTLARLSFLASAGEALAASLDYNRTLQVVAELAIPTLGDLCLVDIVDGTRLTRVAGAHVNPAKADLLEILRSRYAPAMDSPQPAARVVREGRLELLTEVTSDALATHALDEEHAELIRAIGIRSHLAVPLIVRGVTIGVLSLGVTESDRRYGDDDVTLTEELARRAAVAIDHARLYQHAQEELAQRRNAEEALRLSEQRFRAIIEQSPLSTQLLAADGQTLQVNAAWEALWGLTLDDISDYNVLKDPQLEAGGIAAPLRRAFAGEAAHLPVIAYDPNITNPGVSKRSDATKTVRAFAYPIKDGAGAVREVVLVHEDVTVAARSEQQLRTSEERLQMALAAGRMNIWNWDLVTDAVTCSDNAKEFWGIDVGQAADFIAVVHPDDRDRLTEVARAAIAGEQAYVVEYRLRAERLDRWVQSRGRVERSADGQPLRIMGVTVDITELKRAEQRTRLLADAGDTLGASLDYEVTIKGLAALVVPRFADWCAVDMLVDGERLERLVVAHGDPERVAMATDLFNRFPPRRSDHYGQWRVLQTGQPEWRETVEDEMLAAVAQGPEHLALLRGIGLRSFICVPLVARGAAVGVLTLAYAESGRTYRSSDVNLAMDLARRAATSVDNAKLYQQLMIEDRRKNEFLGTLAHELRNPLAPLRTGLSLLGMNVEREVSARTRAVMERQLSHMVRLIDDLLDLSRVTRGTVQLERERVSVRSVFEAAVEDSRPFVDAAGVRLEVHVDEPDPVLDADPTRMSQVLTNLLSNAAKFTDRGGQLRLDARRSGDHVLVRLSDTGVGIPPNMLTSIFDMFVQADSTRSSGQGGLGIGLTLVRRIVELHGGRVWADSEGVGRGSTFTIQLPCAAPASTAKAPQTTIGQAGRAAPRRVLIVDDNADAAAMLCDVLALDGHEVRVAASGAEALQIVGTFRPDAAFLDIGMPGMSGYELARRLRELPQFAGVTLVAITGWGRDEDRRQSSEAGFDRHLTKPVDTDVVRRLVGRAAEPGDDRVP